MKTVRDQTPTGRSAGHWDEIYSTRAHDDLGWFENRPATLPELEACVASGATAVIDIGAGSSRLVDHLLETGVDDVTLLDLSAEAMTAVADRLGDHEDRVTTWVGDVTEFAPSRTWNLWHDRATFHFLTDPADRLDYLDVLNRSLEAGGYAVIATFGPDGPEMCAGLPVVRYDAQALADEFADVLECRGCRAFAGEGGSTDSRPYVICWFQKPIGPTPGAEEES